MAVEITSLARLHPTPVYVPYKPNGYLGQGLQTLIQRTAT